MRRLVLLMVGFFALLLAAAAQASSGTTYSGLTSQPTGRIALTVANGRVSQMTLTYRCVGTKLDSGFRELRTSLAIRDHHFSGTITQNAVSVDIVGTVSPHAIKGSFTGTSRLLGSSCSSGKVTYTASRS